MYLNAPLPKDLLWGVYLNEDVSIESLTSLHLKACQIALHPHKNELPLIKECLSHQITPIITISYGDLLKNLGSWEERSIISKFVSYVEDVYETYKDYVHHFVIFDQPHFIPDTSLRQLYQVMHYIFVAQAEAILCLKAHDASLCVGSMVNDIPGFSTSRNIDAIALMDYNELENYTYMDIYGYGRYPALVKAYFKEAGISLDITTKDRTLLKQASALMDFMGLHYEQCVSVGYNSISGNYASGVLGAYQISSGRRDPMGLRVALRDITSRYQCPILVCFHLLEEESIHDYQAIDDLREHIKEMKKAATEGCQILGFLVDGMDQKHKSTHYYRHVIESQGEDL